MKKTLIFMSIFIVALIAFVDAKDRFQELEEVAANTPAQVEMKQTINPPASSAIKRDINPTKTNVYQNSNQLQQNVIQDSNRSQEKFNKVKERRNTITTPTN